ncbi:MAG: hypothetical protein HY801_05930, partial [Candidatus Lindowbacteria bacterium]|nr:hypothetical protein [Candidatus Lindowbacteria bacterium]
MIEDVRQEDSEFPVCALCGSSDRKAMYKPKKDYVGLSNTFSASQGVLGAQNVVRCAQCGLIYVCPRLKSESIITAYARSVDELCVS